MCTNSCRGKGKGNKWDSEMFDTKCVGVLNFILQETGAEIILSSDWRHTYTLQEMREIFCHNNIIKGPIGFTPSHKTDAMDLEGGRVGEINSWVKLHAWKGDIKWVAIDDMNMEEGLFGHFAWCPNANEGIKRIGVKETIIKVLND